MHRLWHDPDMVTGQLLAMLDLLYKSVLMINCNQLKLDFVNRFEKISH